MYTCMYTIARDSTTCSFDCHGNDERIVYKLNANIFYFWVEMREERILTLTPLLIAVHRLFHPTENRHHWIVLRFECNLSDVTTTFLRGVITPSGEIFDLRLKSTLMLRAATRRRFTMFTRMTPSKDASPSKLQNFPYTSLMFRKRNNIETRGKRGISRATRSCWPRVLLS